MVGWFGASPAAAMQPADLHTVFCAECTTYFDWKSAGMFYTHRVSGMPGPITRLLACSDKQRAVYPQRGMDMGPTFVHPNFANPNPHNGEASGSYNKPAAVMFWTREAKIKETYVLFVDADMLLRAPIDPIALGVRKGMVVSEHVGYLEQGIRHGLVENFIPQSQVHLARAAGWYHIFHLDDLRQIAPRWLHYTERMRTNPQLYWRINGSIPRNIPTGDDYVTFGQPPWISEMYGYMFAAAEQAATQEGGPLARSTRPWGRRGGSSARGGVRGDLSCERACEARAALPCRRASTRSCSTAWCSTRTRPRRCLRRTGRRSSTTACTATSTTTTSPSTTTATSISIDAGSTSSARRRRPPRASSSAQRLSSCSTSPSATSTTAAARPRWADRSRARRTRTTRTTPSARTRSTTAPARRRGAAAPTPRRAQAACRRAPAAAATATRAAASGRWEESAIRTRASCTRRAS